MRAFTETLRKKNEKKKETKKNRKERRKKNKRKTNAIFLVCKSCVI